MYSDMHVVSSDPGIQEKLGIRYNDSDIIKRKETSMLCIRRKE